MKELKKIAFLSIAFAFSGAAMEQKQTVATTTNIPCENHIRLVFMGKTGAGKSTMINAFYNLAEKKEWNHYPKRFPIPTDFQACNVQEYSGRNFEDHGRGQLEAVTQAPSEYIAMSDTYLLSLIDCPGTADTRGIEQDMHNAIKIAKFLAELGNFNAICLVLPVSLNRGTAEAAYFIEEIKSIIPLSAHDRIFICVSYSTADNENIRAFARSVNLPVDTIFNFDNFALSKDGYFDNLDLDLSRGDSNLDDPFLAGADRCEDAARMASNIRKVKSTWTSTNEEFNNLLRAAKRAGKFFTSEMARIAEIKSSLLKNILQAYQNSESIERADADLEKTRREYRSAENAAGNALEIHRNAQLALRVAAAEKRAADAGLCEPYQEKVQSGAHCYNFYCPSCEVVCHDHCYCRLSNNCLVLNDKLNCTVCPNKCTWQIHRIDRVTFEYVTKQREVPGAKVRQAAATLNYDKLAAEFKPKSDDFCETMKIYAKAQADRENRVRELMDMLNSLTSEQRGLKQRIVDLYVNLHGLSMASVNFRIGEYFDICIRREEDPDKRAKLMRDQKFSIEQIALFKRRIGI